MKKVLILGILIMFLTACGAAKNEISKKDEYIFEYNGNKYTLGEEFDAEKYKGYKLYVEIPSCAFSGLDKTYTYDHFEMTFYPDGEKDKLYSIYFLDDSIVTSEGIKISDSIDDLFNKYGDNYTNTGNLYTYQKGKTSISFIVDNDYVTSIEYQYNES